MDTFYPVGIFWILPPPPLQRVDSEGYQSSQVSSSPTWHGVSWFTTTPQLPHHTLSWTHELPCFLGYLLGLIYGLLMLNPLDEDINCIVPPVRQVTMELLEDKLGPSPSCCGAQLVTFSSRLGR